METFWPSTKPASFKPWRNAVTRCVASASDVLRRNPITGIAGCCARAASGHDTVAPPRSGTRDASFYYLVGAGEHGGRNVNAQRPRGFEVDKEVEFRRQHDRQVPRLLALQNTADISAGLAIGVWSAGSV